MIRQNIIANIIARAWGVISVYLFVPLYLKFLGIEAYGLVGFYSTLLGVLAFADMGFTATLNRGMARLSVRKDSAGEMRVLLRTYESTYLCISSLLAVIIWASAPLIAKHWLHSQVLRPHEMAATIRLMGVAIALQMPSGLYIGGLMGLQRQVRANSIQMAWGVFRGLGAVLVLWLFSPTIFAFSLWQLISNTVYCFFARLNLWGALPPIPGPSKPHFEWQVFRSTWRYAAGMAGMAAISTLLSQTDKLTISKMLPLEKLGYYTLAGGLAWIPFTLAGPIGSAVFPRLTGLVAVKDLDSIKRLYHQTCELVAVAIIPAGLTVAVFSSKLIWVWTGSVNAARMSGTAASFLVGGQLLQATTLIPYYLALANGNLKLNIQVGLASIVLTVPLSIVLVKQYGIEGAGATWLVMNICTVPPYMYFLHRRFLPGEFWHWCLRAVARPILAAAPCIFLGRWLEPANSSRLLTFCLIGMVCGLATGVTAVTSLELRREFKHLVSTLARMLPIVHRLLSHTPAAKSLI